MKNKKLLLFTLSLFGFVNANSTDELFNKAKSAYYLGNYNEAANLFKEACEDDDENTKACNKFGSMYLNRKVIFIPKANKQTITLQKICDNDNNINACNKLSKIKKNDRTVFYKKIAKLFEKNCYLGEAKSCTDLGYMYYSGNLIDSIDYNKSKELFENACELGDYEGCKDLGIMYYKGNGVPIDYNKSIKLFIKSCEKNNQEACEFLHIMADTDEEKAKNYINNKTTLLSNFCNESNATACNNLGMLYSKSKLLELDLNKSKILFTKACELNNSAGCNNLGMIYYKGEYINGKFIELDLNKSKILFTKACELNNSAGCNNLGMMYYKGYGVDQNLSMSKNIFEKECNISKNMNACVNLGKMYDNGDFVGKDKIKSRELFLKACEQGNKKACELYKSSAELGFFD